MRPNKDSKAFRVFVHLFYRVPSNTIINLTRGKLKRSGEATVSDHYGMGQGAGMQTGMGRGAGSCRGMGRSVKEMPVTSGFLIMTRFQSPGNSTRWWTKL